MYQVYGFENDLNTGDAPDQALRVLLYVLPFVAMLLASIFSLFLHFNDEKKATDKATTTAANDE